MKRLIMIRVMFVCQIFHISTMYGQLELGQISMPEDQLTHETHSNNTIDKSVDVHESNLDTVSIDGSGNWLEKRILYEKSQAVFDDILVSVNRVVDMRSQFLNEVNAIGHKIDLFYEDVNFDKGQLDNKFKEILVALDFEQKLKGDLSQAERSLQTSIKQELANIDQLGKNIKLIGDVDAKIDQALMQAFKTIDECRDYETKAWAKFKSIAQEIDDKKARNIYYEINNYKENVDQKSTYLSASLLPYLHNVLVAKIESIIAKINESIEQLKQKGIDLSEIMKSEQAHDILILKEREKELHDVAVEQALQLERDKEAQDQAKREAALKKKEEASWSHILYNYYEVAQQAVVDLGSKCMVYGNMIVSSVYSGFLDVTSGIMSYFKKPVVADKHAVDNNIDAPAQENSLAHAAEQPAVEVGVDNNKLISSHEELDHVQNSMDHTDVRTGDSQPV